MSKSKVSHGSPITQKRESNYRDSEAGCHPVQVVGVVTHSHNLGDDSLAGPLNTENLSKLLQVVSSRFTNGEDGVSQPAHAQVAKLLIEELDTKLASQEGNVLDNGKSYSPLLILSELYDCRKKRL